MKSYYDDENVRRDDNFSNSLRMIFIILGVAFVLKWAFSVGIFSTDNMNGPGYKMISPPGWERVPKEEFAHLVNADTTIVSYVTPDKDVLTGKPHGKITAFAIRMPRAMWLEDEWPEILGQIYRSGAKVAQKGEIKVNEHIFNWVLTDDAKNDVITLRFFTFSDAQMQYILSFTSNAKYFNVYRPVFEQVKDSFILKFAI